MVSPLDRGKNSILSICTKIIHLLICLAATDILKLINTQLLSTLLRTSMMSGSLARIPIHRCSSTSNIRPNLGSTLRPKPMYLSEVNIGNVWCDCPDTLFNYMPHRLCMKSNLYKIVDSYLFHHPCLVKSASYI